MIRYIYMLCTLCDFMQKAGRSEVGYEDYAKPA